MKKLSIEVLLSINTKTRQIVSVGPQDPVKKAAQMMTDYNVGLVVVIEKEKLIGVVSERDVIRKWVCGKNFPNPMTVAEIMTADVEVVTPTDTVFDCYLRFNARNCRHLPVVDPFGQILGVLSIRDISGYVVTQLEEQSSDN